MLPAASNLKQDPNLLLPLKGSFLHGSLLKVRTHTSGIYGWMGQRFRVWKRQMGTEGKLGEKREVVIGTAAQLEA